MEIAVPGVKKRRGLGGWQDLVIPFTRGRACMGQKIRSKIPHSLWFKEPSLRGEPGVQSNRKDRILLCRGEKWRGQYYAWGKNRGELFGTVNNKRYKEKILV